MQVMKKRRKAGNFHYNFQEYKNLLTESWGRIKKYEHEWFNDNNNQVSIVNFHDKKHITLISTVYHGSKTTRTERTRAGKRSMVSLPEVVCNYSFGKVGVDVGDQGLRTKMCYADRIRSHRWSLKWVMHAIQTIRSNSFKCWRELNKIKDGKEEQ